MRVGEVRWWRSRRCTFVAVLLAGASLLALPTAPAANAAPAGDAGAKAVTCRAGMSAWKFNKRKVCLPSKLRALPLPALTSSVAGLMRDVVFNDKLGQIARRRSRSRRVRRATSFEQVRRLALGPGGAAAVVKAVEKGTQRVAGFRAATAATRRSSGRGARGHAAADGVEYGDFKFDPVSGKGSIPMSFTGPDGHPISIRIDFGHDPKNPTSNDITSLGVDVSLEVPQKDGRTVATRYAISVAGKGVPDCPAADGTLTGSRAIKVLNTYTVKRGSKILSGPGTISYESKASVRGFVGDNGLLDHAEVNTELDRHQDEHLGLGPIDASAAQDLHASVGGTLDGAGLRAGAATPYAVSNFGASDTVTLGIKVPGLVNASADSRLAYATADELGREGSEVVRVLMTWLAKDLTKAEKHWYTDEGCVKLSASAASDADPSQVIPVTLSEVTAADGKQFKAGVGASGTASITPSSGTYTPGTPADFNLTVPAERGSNGTWKLVVTGKGGKKTTSGTVSVRKLPPPPPVVFPNRFEGTWTRTLTMPTVGAIAGPFGGFTETINGTATFVRDPIIPKDAEGLIPIPYWLESGSVTWTATGSRPAGIGAFPNCTFVYSGGATDPVAADFNSRLRLENVVSDAAPDHFYYAIRATPDPAHASKVDQTATGTCPAGTSTSFDNLSWGDRYLEIGVEDRSVPDAPLDQIQKSTDITLLQGHRTTVSPDGITYDDSWTFHGTN